MGYSIYIGEAELESSTEYEEFSARWSVNIHEEEKAPNFKGDDMTENTNAREPSYTQWANFCKKNNLHDFFFNEDTGLMREHPGCFKLKQEHLDTLKEVLEDLEKKDKRPAGLDERYIQSEIIEIPDDEETHNYDKVRLTWLIWWIEWALKNCKHPAISNT